jgi:hypothetical protein
MTAALNGRGSTMGDTSGVTSAIEPHLEFVPSVVHEGVRVRLYLNRVYMCPVGQTFHEFLIDVVKWTFGERWWVDQVALPAQERHVVVQWTYRDAEFKSSRTDESHRDPASGAFSAPIPGPLRALLTLGYDLYCLQLRHPLPESLLKRLRTRSQFQGARYEVATAAIMTRAGFSLRFLDDVPGDQKRAEFIGTDRYSAQQVAVEAKSRHRAGVLHVGGEFQYESDWRGIATLIRRSRGKKPAGLPYVVFVDVNLPHTPGTDFERKPWLSDVRRALDGLGPPTESNPDEFSALFITCFGDHFGDLDDLAPPPEWGVVIPRFAETPLSGGTMLRRVADSVGRHGQVPDEV